MDDFWLVLIILFKFLIGVLLSFRLFFVGFCVGFCLVFCLSFRLLFVVDCLFCFVFGGIVVGSLVVIPVRVLVGF